MFFFFPVTDWLKSPLKSQLQPIHQVPKSGSERHVMKLNTINTSSSAIDTPALKRCLGLKQSVPYYLLHVLPSWGQFPIRGCCFKGTTPFGDCNILISYLQPFIVCVGRCQRNQPEPASVIPRERPK